jgi:hypothetical protein
VYSFGVKFLGVNLDIGDDLYPVFTNLIEKTVVTPGMASNAGLVDLQKNGVPIAINPKIDQSLGLS